MEKDYFQKVYSVVLQIPHGKVTTYGLIAEFLGSKRKARVVGYALNSALAQNYPCHRVVNRNGELSGSTHFETPTLMRELLEAEDISFKDGKVDLSKHLWIPNLE